MERATIEELHDVDEAPVMLEVKDLGSEGSPVILEEKDVGFESESDAAPVVNSTIFSTLHDHMFGGGSKGTLIFSLVPCAKMYYVVSELIVIDPLLAHTDF